MARHDLTNEEWSKLSPLLPKERGRVGCPPTLSNRDFMNAISYICKTGILWRDLPDRFGPWQTVYGRFNRWNKKNLFDAVLENFAQDRDLDADIVDASYVKAHQDSAGGKGGMFPTRRPQNRWF